MTINLFIVRYLLIILSNKKLNMDFKYVSSFDKSNNIYIESVHDHDLFLATYRFSFICNVCTKMYENNGYHCPDCDFDYCLKCHESQNIPEKLPPLFLEKPMACDFYKRNLRTKAGSEYYQQMLDMFFELLSDGNRCIWTLSLENPERNIHMVLGTCVDTCECNKSDCNNCKTLLYCKNCQLAIRLKCGEKTEILCDCAKPNNYSECLDANKKHLYTVLQHYYPTDIIMTLEGVYCA